MATLRAGGVWFGDIKRRFWQIFGAFFQLLGELAEHFFDEIAAVFQPLKLHHDRKPVDNDVEKTAKD